MRKSFLKSVAVCILMLTAVCQRTFAQEDESVTNFSVEFPAKLMYLETTNVNLRTAPNPRAEKFYQYGMPMHLPTYQLFPVAGERNGWVKVVYGIDEPYVSKQFVKFAQPRPLDMENISNNIITYAGADNYWVRIATPKSLPNTVVWIENTAEDDLFTITIGKLNADKTILAGKFTRNIYMEYSQQSPSSSISVSDAQNRTCLDAAVITFGRQYLAWANSNAQLDITQIPLNVLQQLFQSDKASWSSQYITTDILK